MYVSGRSPPALLLLLDCSGCPEKAVLTVSTFIVLVSQLNIHLGPVSLAPLSPLLPSLVRLHPRLDSAESTALNTSRLKILRAREQLLADLFEEARKGVHDLNSDEGKYSQLMEQLILQVRLQTSFLTWKPDLQDCVLT
jgi:hypothetical protein